jgi:hypothetical protein
MTVQKDSYLTKKEIKNKRLLTIKESAKWASEFLNREITESNIAYLINYGRIKKYKINEKTFVDIEELKKYYEENILNKEKKVKEKLGLNLNWELSLIGYPKEKELNMFTDCTLIRGSLFHSL